MWRPRKLGNVIAERTLRFEGPRKPDRVVRLRLGQPVRARRPKRGDPWWCPVEIRGLGNRSLRPIAGEDSVQAIGLAFEFVTHVLPIEAEGAGGHLEWLGGARTFGLCKHSLHWTGKQGVAESRRSSRCCNRRSGEWYCQASRSHKKDRGRTEVTCGIRRLYVRVSTYT